MTARLRYTNDQIIRIIREVKNHPCIWNKGNENFNKIYHVGQAWIAISEQLGLSENVAKRKWKNLRDTFHRIVNRNPQTLISYKGEWPFFHEMLFLIKSVPKKPLKPSIHAEFLDLDECDSEDIIVFSVNNPEDDVSNEDLPYSSDRYDLLFLESLAPYFKELDPIRRVTMRGKIQEMLMMEISAQNDESLSQSSE